MNVCEICGEKTETTHINDIEVCDKCRHKYYYYCDICGYYVPKEETVLFLFDEKKYRMCNSCVDDNAWDIEYSARENAYIVKELKNDEYDYIFTLH